MVLLLGESEMNEQAGVSKKYEKHFLLDKLKFRKICGVIREHSKKLREKTYI